MDLVIHKYGGSSLKTPRHIRFAAKRIQSTVQAGNRVVAVVSAMGKMTDHLMKLAKRTVDAPSPRELDMLLTTGERVSMSLLAMALENSGVPAISFTGSQSGILTNGHHTKAEIIDIKPKRIQEALEKNKVVIIAGFQGVSPDREITTLGRGGSDTTAVALAAALGARECLIFTDVAGIFTADPQIVATARPISDIDYDLGLELASLGAKMHPRSLDLARRHLVKVVIKSSFEESLAGTTIQEEKMENPDIRAVATQNGFHFCSAKGTLGEIAGVAKLLGVSLKFFKSDGRNVQFLVKNEETKSLQAAMTEKAISHELVSSVSVVSAVGHGISMNADILSEFLKALDGIETLLVTSSSLSISAAIKTSDITEAANRLHKGLVETTSRSES